MEIKTTGEIIDDQFITIKDKHTLRTINLTRPREDIGKYRYKKWVAADNLEILLKSCLRRKNIKDIKGNIKSILNAFSNEKLKEE